MKQTISFILALLLLSLSFSSAFCESPDTLQQAVDSMISGSAEINSLDSLLSTLSESAEPGSVVTQTWTGDDGVTYSIIFYAEPAVTEDLTQPQPQETEETLNTEELLAMLDWLETQLRTEAAEGYSPEETIDPAVYYTAQPAVSPTLDPAVWYTAQPMPDPTIDPAVWYTAQPMPAATPDPYPWYTTQSTPAPTPEPWTFPTVYPGADPTAVPAPQPVWHEAPSAVPSAPTVVVTAQPTAAPTISTGDYTTFDSTMQEQKLLNLVNEDRARNGLPPLALDPELSQLAKLKSSDMSSNHYFAHESPTYGNAVQMLDTFHYDYSGVGENIAHHANVEKAEAAFMSSDGHRRNILGSQWDKVGIGIAYDENGNVYVTQLFAR